MSKKLHLRLDSGGRTASNKRTTAWFEPITKLPNTFTFPLYHHLSLIQVYEPWNSTSIHSKESEGGKNPEQNWFQPVNYFVPANWSCSNARQNFHFNTSRFNKSLIRVLWRVWSFSPHQVPVVFILSAVVLFHPVFSSALLVKVSTSRRRSRAGQVAACVSSTAKCPRTLIKRVFFCLFVF